MAIRLTTLLKEPLFHFLILGAGLFYGYSLLNEQEFTNQGARGQELTNQGSNSHRSNTQGFNTPEQAIIVDAAKIAQLSSQFESQHKRPPFAAELDGLVDEFIREEIMVREAKKLTLDQGDAVIRRRLLQKMAFLNTSFLANLRPVTGELEAFYSDNIESYSAKEKLAFEQVFLGQEIANNQQQQILQLLKAKQDPGTLLPATFLPAETVLSEQRDIERTFGQGFFQQIQPLKQDQWQGPVQSAYGWHFIRLSERQVSQPLAFDQVKAKVERDWRDAREQEILTDQYNKLKAQYTISRSSLTDVGA